MDKGEFSLSESRKQELRSLGLVSISKEVITLAAFLGLYLGCYLFISKIDLSQFQGQLQGKQLEGRSLNAVFSLILGWAGILPACIALCVILGTLFQSRFLIGFTENSKPTNFTSPIYRGTLQLAQFLILGAAGWLCLKRLGEIIYVRGDLLDFFKLVSGVYLGLLFIFALIGKFLMQLAFTQHHRMTFEEMMSEAREGEMRPEVRAAADRIFAEEE